jgi:hypothetical protein
MMRHDNPDNLARIENGAESKIQSLCTAPFAASINSVLEN